jgi:hypothetical protein
LFLLREKGKGGLRAINLVNTGETEGAPEDIIGQVHEGELWLSFDVFNDEIGCGKIPLERSR